MVTADIGDVIRITIEADEIDFDNFKPIQERIHRILRAHPRDIVINMERVDFIDSAGIAMLLKVIESVDVEKRSIDFVNFTDNVRNTLTVVNLSRIFKIV
ncbi:MAG TPA: STAS domain-containing protein [Spirochaetota bacterium]|nr:STAS domain-containing protein [Spirochaetota bacterium]HNT10014.1 STAS domain-containing protein [Spirochaetota bacterium]HNV47387.1 STAS domain-containing protein [Spirochaetota bacterium]HOS39717.1 STAS domain-containing protein [Spirochaetota bacterium]HPI23502.1 STAS domain-containing protein [Spirochaetota bacterium]